MYTVLEAANRVESGDYVLPWSRAMWALGRAVAWECQERLEGLVMLDVAPGRQGIGNLVLSEVKAGVRGAMGKELAYRGVDKLVGELVTVRELPRAD